MAKRVILAIGTKKGLFIAEAVKARRRFALRGPFGPGVAVYAALIDTRDTDSKATPVDVWELAASLEECGIGRHNRIAVLNDPKDDFDRAAFLETCAANRGFSIKAFRDFEQALYWLAGNRTGPGEG